MWLSLFQRRCYYDFKIGFDWKKAAKLIMKRDSINDYDQAYKEVN
jgi:hypothetical protein